MIRQEESNILTAKYIAEKWSEPIYEVVRNSTPEIQAMPEQNVRFIIGLCSGWNIMFKTLYNGVIDSPQWASSVAECSIITAFLMQYRYNTLAVRGGDKNWANQIENARKGLFGEIPGANIRIVVNEKIIPRYTRRLNPPERTATKTKTIERYYPNAAKTYLMRDENTGCTKIGKSVNPRVRERTLLSDKPTITLFMICDNLVEKELHAKYADKRVRGEWFNLTSEDIADIKENYNFYEYDRQLS